MADKDRAAAQVAMLAERDELLTKIDERANGAAEDGGLGLDMTPIAPIGVRAGAQTEERGDAIACVDLHFLRRLDATLQELADRRAAEEARREEEGITGDA